MNLEAFSEKIVFNYRFRFIIPIVIFLVTSIGWIYNEINPILAFIMSVTVSSLIFLILSMKNLCKSLIIGLFLVLVLFNLYIFVLTLFMLLMILTSFEIIDFIVCGLALILISLDSIGIVHIVRRLKVLDFREIQISNLKMGIVIIFCQLVFYLVLWSLLDYFRNVYIS